MVEVHKNSGFLFGQSCTKYDELVAGPELATGGVVSEKVFLETSQNS